MPGCFARIKHGIQDVFAGGRLVMCCDIVHKSFSYTVATTSGGRRTHVSHYFYTYRGVWFLPAADDVDIHVAIRMVSAQESEIRFFYRSDVTALVCNRSFKACTPTHE
ncbi:hypothetical protein NP493_353g04032 [Ridgeia piscesae]|uniref:Uncharacterized protein n=1 Tax=Ridgeia piscesae TaxID=27915 RepID=A0AAD9NVH5_RIDPI|nr:hypothetical protein NP493_353g04032 [Ridgeia piscesae]